MTTISISPVTSFPFGIYQTKRCGQTKAQFIPRNVEFIISEIELIEPDKNQVKLVKRITRHSI